VLGPSSESEMDLREKCAIHLGRSSEQRLTNNLEFVKNEEGNHE
jgi:hypothetical protein